MAHLLASNVTRVPELELDQDEGKLIADQAMELMKFYGVREPRADILLWFNAIGLAGKIYGPRFGAYKLRKANERAKADPAPSTEINAGGVAVSAPQTPLEFGPQPAARPN